ncbi:MAG: trypsin-like serine protease [Gemmatimonadota bacterium]|nr:trypsin-like serine protease [Gemmatimonadota bacterium]
MSRTVSPRSSFLLAVAVFVPLVAAPIVTRHDTDDAAHRELAERFPSLVHLNLPDGEAVLIRPEWVLTAAHVAVEVEPGDTLTLAGGDVEVSRVFVHPDWDDGPADIALLRLSRPAVQVQPVDVYRERDEAGQLIYLVGAGYGGSGLTGPDGVLGELRAATNRIDEASDHWLKFRFDDPREEGSAATDLEGISGPGDSGGPAYVERDGVQFVVGVSSGQSTGATGGVEGVYGVTEYYTRVSSYLEWIEATIGGTEP